MTGSDRGTGLLAFKLSAPGIDTTKYSTPTPCHTTNLNWQRFCPVGVPVTKDVSYTPVEGIQTYTIKAVDAAENITSRTWEERIDRTRPEVTLTGNAVDATYLGAGNYGFRADATDGTSSTRGSGVKNLTVVLANSVGAETVLYDSGDVPCGSYNCPLGKDLQIAAGALAEGRYTLIARTTDHVSQNGSAEKALIVNRQAPTLTVTGDLKDASDGVMLSPAEDADLRITATDSDGVVSSRIQITGRPDVVKTQACATSPCDMTHDYLQVLSVLGPGTRTVVVTVTDPTGRETKDQWDVAIDDQEAVPSDDDPDAPVGGASSRSDNDPARYKTCESMGAPVPFETLSLGPAFEGLAPTQVLRRCDDPYPGEDIRANFVSYIYGTCAINEDTDDDRCAPPLEIQTWPACERSIADIALGPANGVLDALIPGVLNTIRGVPTSLMEDGLRLELYTGRSTVVIFGIDPTQILRAVAQLRLEPSGPAALPSTLTSVGTLLGPVTGALVGTLSCAS